MIPSTAGFCTACAVLGAFEMILAPRRLDSILIGIVALALFLTVPNLLTVALYSRISRLSTQSDFLGHRKHVWRIMIALAYLAGLVLCLIGLLPVMFK